MHEPPTAPPLGQRLQAISAWRPAVPAWLISMILHLTVLIVLGLTIRLAPQPAVGTERTAQVGIVLKHQEGKKDYYVGEQDGGSRSSAPAADVPSLADALSPAATADPTRVLPESPLVIGPGVLDGGGAGNAVEAAAGPGSGRGLDKGMARVEVFGAVAEGSRFVYVFDRSASMEGGGRSPLTAAKAELLASLDSLGKVHQFQIIFYNEQPWIFNPSGQPGKLAFGNEQNKNRAKRFVGRITAAGGTRHLEALNAALRMQPDVIFFLTDADEPRLSPSQLERIHRKAGESVSINTIEFGYGPKSGSENFLAKLARQNNGQYAYVNITRLGAPAAPRP